MPESIKVWRVLWVERSDWVGGEHEATSIAKWKEIVNATNIHRDTESKCAFVLERSSKIKNRFLVLQAMPGYYANYTISLSDLKLCLVLDKSCK